MVPILLSEYLGVERIQVVGNLAGSMVTGLLMDKVNVASPTEPGLTRRIPSLPCGKKTTFSKCKLVLGDGDFLRLVYFMSTNCENAGPMQRKP